VVESNVYKCYLLHMTETTVISARIDVEIVAALDALASRLGRSRAALLADAARAYVDEQTSFYAFVEEGERDIDEGRYYTREQMDDWFAERIAEARSRQGRAAAA
jgi:predicted transcriptional regulator